MKIAKNGFLGVLELSKNNTFSENRVFQILETESVYKGPSKTAEKPQLFIDGTSFYFRLKIADFSPFYVQIP